MIENKITRIAQGRRLYYYNQSLKASRPAFNTVIFSNNQSPIACHVSNNPKIVNIGYRKDRLLGSDGEVLLGPDGENLQGA